MPVSEVEAWSLLGRVHAMNEKEDKALAAFEAGRKALEAGQGGANIAGEMLTVSPHAHLHHNWQLTGRISQYLMSTSQKT